MSKYAQCFLLASVAKNTAQFNLYGVIMCLESVFLKFNETTMCSLKLSFTHIVAL